MKSGDQISLTLKMSLTSMGIPIIQIRQYHESHLDNESLFTEVDGLYIETQTSVSVFL